METFHRFSMEAHPPLTPTSPSPAPVLPPSTAPTTVVALASSEGVTSPSELVTPSEGAAPPASPTTSLSNRTSPSLPAPKVSWASVLSEIETNDILLPVPDRTSKGVVRTVLPVELLKDQVPLWTKYIAGHFIGDVSPHIGKVHATMNRLWTTQDKKARIDAQFISPKVVLFRIDDETMRRRVLQRHFWHVSDIPMIVQEWSPSTAGKSPDLSSIPLWVDFIKVPDTLFSRKGLFFLGNLVGNAQKLHPTTERCTRFDVARILVEVNLNFDLPSMIKLNGDTEITIPIAYPWLPPRCSKCGSWGHKDIDCITLPETIHASSTSEKRSSPDRIPIVEPALVSVTRGPTRDSEITEEVIEKDCPVLETDSVALGSNLGEDKSSGLENQHQAEEQVHAHVSRDSAPVVADPIVTTDLKWTFVVKSKGSPGRSTMARGKSIVTDSFSPSHFHVLATDQLNQDDIEDGEIHGLQNNVTLPENDVALPGNDVALPKNVVAPPENVEAATYAPQASFPVEELKETRAPKNQVGRQNDQNRVTRQSNKSKKSSSRKA